MTGVPAQGKFPPWLDIIETLGRTPDHPYWYIHAGGKEAGGGWNVANMAADWHTFGTEWKADEFIFYFDGVEKMRDRTLAPLVRMNMCWALELMVGDNNAGWIGSPNASSWAGVYEVDYVRIYRNAGPPSALRPLSRAFPGASILPDALPDCLVNGRRLPVGGRTSPRGLSIFPM
jgi:beta-glucanase (GH16 family)